MELEESMAATTMRKQRADRPIEGRLAKWYAANTAEMMKEYRELAERIAKRLPRGAAVLEVAPGPGYFCVELARLGDFEITGLDLSQSFVEMASKHAAAAGVMVKFLHGSASKMPLDGNSFDFLLCRAAFKNFGEPVKALQEMYRVLKPGGTGLIIDLKRNANRKAVDQYVEAMNQTWMNKVMTKLTFKTFLIRSAYMADEFTHMIASTPFGSAVIEESELGLEVNLKK